MVVPLDERSSHLTTHKNPFHSHCSWVAQGERIQKKWPESWLYRRFLQPSSCCLDRNKGITYRLFHGTLTPRRAFANYESSSVETFPRMFLSSTRALSANNAARTNPSKGGTTAERPPWSDQDRMPFIHCLSLHPDLPSWVCWMVVCHTRWYFADRIH